MARALTNYSPRSVIWVGTTTDVDFLFRDTRQGDPAASQLSDAELDALSGTASVFTVDSDGAITASKVSNAADVALVKVADDQVGHFRFTIPSNAALADATDYFVQGSVSATDASTTTTFTTKFTVPVTAFFVGT